MQDDSDIDNLYSVFGRIKDKLSSHLFDSKDRIVPSVEMWVLKQCDINIDIDIPDRAQMYLPNIQLKSLGNVFRMYVKSLAERFVYRTEDSKETNSPLLSTLRRITHPYYDLETKMNNLQAQLNKISASMENNRYSTCSPSLFTIF